MESAHKQLLKFLFPVLLMIVISGCVGRSQRVEVQDVDGDGFISMDEILGNVELPNPINIVRQPVTIVSNPIGSTLVECAVLAGKRGNAPWSWATHSSLASINVMRSDDSGRMWVATEGHGLAMFDGQAWTQWDETADMPFNVVRGVGVGSRVAIGAVDYPLISAETIDDERIYKASILLYEPASGSWEEIFQFESEIVEPNDEYFAGLTVAADGRIFLPMTFLETRTEEGDTSVVYANKLGIYDGESWRFVEIPFGISGVNDAAFDSQGNYWMATQNLGVFKYDGQEWDWYSAGKGFLPVNSVKGIAITEDDVVWAATSAGLGVIFQDGVGKVLLLEDYPLGDIPVEDITIDKQQRLWILSNERVTVYNGRQWAIVKDTNVNRVRNWSYNIATDSDGCIWAAESGNVSVPVFLGNLRLNPGDYSELYSLLPE